MSHWSFLFHEFRFFDLCPAVLLECNEWNLWFSGGSHGWQGRWKKRQNIENLGYTEGEESKSDGYKNFTD